MHLNYSSSQMAKKKNNRNRTTNGKIDKQTITLLNFKVNKKETHNTLVWLIAKFSLALWKSRMKKNARTITQYKIETINRKIRFIKMKKNYKEHFNFP